MLNTTSPTFVPSAPNAFPCHTDPSSKTNLQGFWTSHGFEIAPLAKHFKVAFLPPLDKEEEKEVEHDDEAEEEVFPTRPLNDDDNCWCCAQDDDMFVFQTSFFFLRKRSEFKKGQSIFVLLSSWPFVFFFVPVGTPPNLSFSLFSSVRCTGVVPPHIYFVVQREKDIFLLSSSSTRTTKLSLFLRFKSASRQQLRFKTCNRCASSQILERRRCRERARVIALILITALLKNHHHLCCHPFPEDDENEMD